MDNWKIHVVFIWNTAGFHNGNFKFCFIAVAEMLMTTFDILFFTFWMFSLKTGTLAVFYVFFMQVLIIFPAVLNLVIGYLIQSCVWCLMFSDKFQVVIKSQIHFNKCLVFVGNHKRTIFLKFKILSSTTGGLAKLSAYQVASLVSGRH